MFNSESLTKLSSFIYHNFAWGAIFAFCVGGCIYNLREIVNTFNDEPTAISYRIHPKQNLTFPKLGICSLMPLNVTKLLEQGYSMAAISALHWHFTQEHYTVTYINFCNRRSFCVLLNVASSDFSDFTYVGFKANMFFNRSKQRCSVSKKLCPLLY